MGGKEFKHLYLGRVEQTIIDGEVVEVRVFPLKPKSNVNVQDGAHYISMLTKVDLFEDLNR